MPLLTNLGIEDPCSDSTALGHEQIGLELTAERLGPNGARRSQAAGNALAFAVHDFALADPLVVGHMR